MNRFHVHMAVEDLPKNIAFYSALFNAQPSVLKVDYAKWMLDDPRINFAISSRSSHRGIDHLGIQVDQAEDLTAIKTRYDAADASSVTSEPGTICCYSKSDKHWITDPQGIAWEAFQSLGSVPTFHATATENEASACCTPTTAATSARGKPISIKVNDAASSCC